MVNTAGDAVTMPFVRQNKSKMEQNLRRCRFVCDGHDSVRTCVGRDIDRNETIHRDCALVSRRYTFAVW